MGETFMVQAVETNILGSIINRSPVYKDLPSAHRARILIREWYGVKRFQVISEGIQVGHMRPSLWRKLTFYVVPQSFYDEAMSYVG